MSEIKTDKLTGVGTAGSIVVTGEGNSTTTNLQQGLIKTFATLDGTGTIAFRDSFNQSAATDNGTGRYIYNFTNAFSDRNRCITLSCNKGEDTSRPYVIQEVNTPTASTCEVDIALSNSPGDTDVEDAYMAGIGDLA